jgi:hypothetical protein
LYSFVAHVVATPVPWAFNKFWIWDADSGELIFFGQENDNGMYCRDGFQGEHDFEMLCSLVATHVAATFCTAFVAAAVDAGLMTNLLTSQVRFG